MQSPWGGDVILGFAARLWQTGVSEEIEQRAAMHAKRQERRE